MNSASSHLSSSATSSLLPFASSTFTSTSAISSQCRQPAPPIDDDSPSCSHDSDSDQLLDERVTKGPRSHSIQLKGPELSWRNHCGMAIASSSALALNDNDGCRKNASGEAKICKYNCKSTPNLPNQTPQTTPPDNDEPTDKYCSNCRPVDECPWCQSRKSDSIGCGVATTNGENLLPMSGGREKKDICDKHERQFDNRCCCCSCCSWSESNAPSNAETDNAGMTAGKRTPTDALLSSRPDVTNTIVARDTSRKQLKQSTFV